MRGAREQERRATALEARLAQAELAVLRAQLEPHFLFNALNTAVSLVRAGEPAAGVDVLTRLADVLRHLLDGVAQETPLADELPGSTTVLRALGVLLVVVGVDLALASRLRGRRLALAGTVAGELALGWALVSTVVVLAAGAGAAVTAAALAVAAVSAAFGVVQLRLARGLRT